MPRAASRLLLILAAVAVACCSNTPARAETEFQKETKWYTNYEQALALAKKQERIVIAYFCGSDWDPWTQKLDKDVLDTDMFRTWAAANVVLLKVDFLKEKHLSSLIKAQNDKLKAQFSISKVPTFVFLDSAGLPFARAGWDQAKLRGDERTGAPRAWIKYLDETVKGKPRDETLTQQKTLEEGMAFGRKHFISMLVLITQGHAAKPMEQKADLLHNQQFIRFVNRNLAFVSVEWPDETDASPQAESIRGFLVKNKIEAKPIQLLVWDMQTNKVKGRIAGFDPNHVDGLIATIESQLPRLDYNNGWIEDYRKAQAIAAQQKRYIFLTFTAMDSSDWCKKIDEEIFQTDDFKKYARKYMVLVRIDFPSATTQPEGLVTQNKNLAEMFAVRGFPMVIVLNPLGQRVGEAKYMKGGPGPFLTELSAIVKKDTERRAMLAGDDAPQ